MKSQSSEEYRHGGLPPWLASVLLKRGRSLLPRFVFYRQRLARRPRHWRRRLRRQLAVTVTGAALLLAMAGASAQGEPAAPDAAIAVVNGQVAVSANGQCSLIEAILNAESTTTGRPHTDCAAGNPSGPDAINLPNNGLFTLTAVNNTNYGPNGLPVINSTITINGRSSTIRRAPTAPNFRIFSLNDSGDLTLNFLTIENGKTTAGGGAVAFFSSSDVNLTLNNTTLSNHEGGAIVADYCDALTITNSQIINSTTTDDGGAIYLHDCPATITNSTLSGNTAGGRGGAISIYNMDLTITDSTLSNNSAVEKGGGVYGDDADVFINRSTVSGNSAERGGGLFFHYFASENKIVNSTISDNEADFGGGVFVSHEYYGYRPAAAAYGTVISNSTITGNNAVVHGGGLDGDGKTELKRTLIAGNTAGAADEVFSHDNQVIGDRWNLFGRAGINNAAAFQGFTPSGSDLNATSNGLNVPLANILSPLANNGGPTLTHALPAGSPALDAAPSNTCTTSPIFSLDQRSQPRNQNGAGGASSNECDIGAFERGGGGPPPVGAFYISPAQAGTVGGVAFAPADIIKFDPATGWSMYFDGSDVGITKNVSAFELQNDGSILLSLSAGQTVGGAGAVAPHDILRFVPSSTGNNTNGTFTLHVDGSTIGLTTTGEKIDALGLTADGRIAVSTTGALAAPKAGGGTLKTQDEDAAGFNRTAGVWSAFFDGTAVAGLGVEDVNALWVHPTTGDLYISILGAFNLGGVAGDGKDIVKLTPSGGSYTPSLHWDGSTAGLPTTIDALEIVP